MKTTVSIAKDFSRFPAGRFKTDGKFSGEVFRQRHLAPKLRTGQQIEVDLNGTLGYGSSFLEEAFGGLVRVEQFTVAELEGRLKFVSDDPSLIDECWGYIQDAGRQAALG